MISTLSLDIKNNGDCGNFRITDSSYYNPTLPITCVHLLIKTPVSGIPVEFEVEPYFSSVFNNANLNIQNTTNDCLTVLPDGIYYIKYSINPNDRIYVEYNYLQNCIQIQNFIELSCKTFSSKCNYTYKEYKAKLKELDEIKELIDGAKYLVDYCNNPEDGMLMYNEANSLISKYKVNGNCSNCG
jgi:hypothetical protein